MLQINQPIFGNQTPEKNKKLKTQLETILAFMDDGQWHSVQEMSGLTGYPENSVQAQFRNARKLGYQVAREDSNGLSRYRLVGGQPQPKTELELAGRQMKNFIKKFKHVPGLAPVLLAMEVSLELNSNVQVKCLSK